MRVGGFAAFGLAQDRSGVVQQLGLGEREQVDMIATGVRGTGAASRSRGSPRPGRRPSRAGRGPRPERAPGGRSTRTDFVRLPANGQWSLPAISKGHGHWRQCAAMSRRASSLSGPEEITMSERMHNVRVTLTNGHAVSAVEFLGRFFTERGVEITRQVVAVAS